MTSSAMPAASQVQRRGASTLSDPATSALSAAAAAVKSPTAAIATAPGTTARDHPGLPGRLARWLAITGAVPSWSASIEGRTSGANNYRFLPDTRNTSVQAHWVGSARSTAGRLGPVSAGKLIPACAKSWFRSAAAALPSARPRPQGGIRRHEAQCSQLGPTFQGLPPDPASRTAYDPGEVAQCDFWFPSATVPVEGFGQLRRPAQLPVLTMVSGYSRWLSAPACAVCRSQADAGGFNPGAARLEGPRSLPGPRLAGDRGIPALGVDGMRGIRPPARIYGCARHATP